MATRKASGEVLGAIAPHLPDCGVGRPTSPSRTTPRRKASPAISPEHSTKLWTADWFGRVLHFGIREHAMGSILNGIALHGGTRPYGGTSSSPTTCAPRFGWPRS